MLADGLDPRRAARTTRHVRFRLVVRSAEPSEKRPESRSVTPLRARVTFGLVVERVDASAPSGWGAEQVRGVLARARKAWPELEPPTTGFVEHVAARLEPNESIEHAVDVLRVEELYLAYRCQRGDGEAIKAFERRYAASIATSVRRVNSPVHSIDDLRQLVRLRLFVGENAAIHAYSGRGALAAWVGVVALRTTLNAVRGKSRVTSQSSEDDVEPRLDDLVDPELDYLRSKYRADFRAAFDEAVEGLTARERTLLRQHLVQKLTVRELGRMYAVNSGTVSRWIVRAREGLAQRTCQALQSELEVSADELESILEMIRSKVDLSITRVLGTTRVR